MAKRLISILWCFGCILGNSGTVAVLNKNKLPLLKLSIKSPDAILERPFLSKILSVPSPKMNDQKPGEVSLQNVLSEMGNTKIISKQKCNSYVSELINREKLTEKKYKYSENTSKTKIFIRKQHSTKKGEYPHMAAIGWRSKERKAWIFLCGGTLISSHFVLSAAHCSSQVSNNALRTEPDIVRLGRRNKKSYFKASSDIKIKRFINHPDWAPPIQYNDIALIERVKTVQFSTYIQPACLPWDRLTPEKAIITGWGVTNETSKSLSTLLQFAEVDIINSDTCNSLLDMFSSRRWSGVKDTQLCAGSLEGGVDACQGDSGGPLQTKLLETEFEGTMHVIIGVTSFGFHCGVKEQPGIYTKVSSYLEWIEKIVWPFN